MSVLKQCLGLGGLCLASLGIATPSLSKNCVGAYKAALSEARSGQKARAVATIDCMLLPHGLTVGLGQPGAMAMAVDRGVAIWGDRLDHFPLAFSSSPDPDLKVVFVHDISSGGDVQGEVRCRRNVYWGRTGNGYKVKGVILIRDNVEGRRITSTEATSVIEHELGHVLGLEDDGNPERLMGPFVAGQPVDGPSPEEVQLVSSYRAALRAVRSEVGHVSVVNSRGAGKRGHRSQYR